MTDTASYKIERMRMNTGVDALNDTEWQFVGRAIGDTSFTDRTPLREDADGETEETRMYQVGSEATGQTEVQFELTRRWTTASTRRCTNRCPCSARRPTLRRRPLVGR